MEVKFKCPVCKKEVQKDNKYFPFDCERCKYVDLGRWFSEDYYISVDKEEEDDGTEL